MLLKFMALLISIVPMVSAQENVLHHGETGDSQSVIVTARTRAFLSCESGDIVVKVNFTQPFRGLMYAHRSRNSPCRVHGTGGFYYQLRIPLKGCGTWQETPRVFVNNVTIRFHPALELEEDETKTVVCRYPPPLTPAPGNIQVIEPPTLGPNPVPTRIGTARLSEVEILIIICLLLFLSLLTLGIGIAYFCLKRRNIHIVRKSTIASSAPPSQITRLSSSNIPPPSSLLSSVLGHTVRIPRAVPYSVPAGRASMLSSPDHHYEEYPVSTSTSGEPSETSVSSSSDDQADVSKHLLFKKVGPRSLLSIPKAILRKTGPKKSLPQPLVHTYHSKASTSSVGTSIRQPEMEDQTVITVLEPEGQIDDHGYWSVRNGVSHPDRQIKQQTTEFQKSETSKKPIPVYAQVDKNKKIIQRSQEMNIEKLNISRPEIKAPRMPSRPPPLLGAARRQRSTITDIPEESSTSEEITKNTTVTTSVRREVTETRILSPSLSKGIVSSDTIDGASELSTTETDSRLSQTENPEVQTAHQNTVLHQPPKNILIRDVADIYLTTTVETESRELKTHISRDIVEEHARTDTVTPSPKDVPTAKPELKTSSPTGNWNVVIRQRQPPPTLQADSARESNGEEREGTQPEAKPKFDVKIRAIPPSDLKTKEPQKMVTIPPLEMPRTISKLKEALMPKTVETSPEKTLPEKDSNLKDEQVKPLPENKDKTSLSQRTVRWMDDTQNATKDSTVSSSDSFQSAESLRERSSSEVLEVVPTLPSQRKNSDHPMLERSTSEIVTSPEDHVRWVGGVVPVLETLSPEFLANIPVIQGGFFNSQRAPSPKDKQKPTTS